MATVAQVKAAVKKLGGEVLTAHDDRTYVYEADAPEGYVWKATLGQTMVAPCYKGGPKSWLEEAMDDLLERVGLGITESKPVPVAE